MCRAHEVVYDGFHYNRERNVATICSLADYCGLFNNSAAVMNVDNNLNVFFRVVKERKYFPIERNPDQSPEAHLERIAREKRKARKEK